MPAELTTEHINRVIALARKGLGVVTSEASTEMLCKCSESIHALAMWADEQAEKARSAGVDNNAPPAHIEKATP